MKYLNKLLCFFSSHRIEIESVRTDADNRTYLIKNVCSRCGYSEIIEPYKEPNAEAFNKAIRALDAIKSDLAKDRIEPEDAITLADSVLTEFLALPFDSTKEERHVVLRLIINHVLKPIADRHTIKRIFTLSPNAPPSSRFFIGGNKQRRTPEERFR